MTLSRLLLVGLLLLFWPLSSAAEVPGLVLGRGIERKWEETSSTSSHSYGLPLALGQYARVVVDQQGADVAVLVQSPTGEAILLVDSPADRYGAETVSIIAEIAGLYTLTVQPRTAVEGEIGGYRIELQALRMPTPEDRLRTAAEWENAKAYALSRQGRPESPAEAVAGYRRALETWKALGDRSQEAATHYRLGMAFFLAQKPAEAAASYKTALEIWREQGEERETAKTLNQIGRTCRLLGDTHCASDAFQESISLARTLGLMDAEGAYLNNLAKLHADLGDLSSAAQAYSQAAALFRAQGDPSGEALIENALGAVYDLQGRPTEALGHFARALEVARHLRHSSLEGDSLKNLGSLYQRLGQPHKALEYFLPALDRYSESKIFASQGLVLVDLGSLLADLGERDEGDEMLVRALPLLRDPRDQARARLLRSQIARDEGDPGKALRLAEEALATSRKLRHPAGEAAARRSLGFLLLDRHQAGPARESLEQALRLFAGAGSLLGQAETLRGLGQASSGLGDFPAADGFFDQALALSRELGNTAEEAHVLAEMARSRQARGDLAAARAPLEASLDRLESLRSAIAGDDFRASHFAAQRQVYEEYVGLLLRLDREKPAAGLAAGAFAAAERARARGLLDFLGQARVDLREGDPALLDEERRLRLEMNAKAALRVDRLRKTEKAAELAAIDQELTTLTTRYQIVEARLQANSPRYAELRQPAVSLAGIQHDVLDPDTVLLEYFLAEPRSVLWLVTPGSIDSFELPGRAEIEVLARRVHETLGQPSTQGAAEERKNLAELSRVLLGPVLGRIAGKRLAIAADGALWYLPFAALPVPGRDGAEVPLVVEHEIVAIPSAAVLRELRRARQGRLRPAGALAVVADPVFDTGDTRLQAARATLPPERPKAEATIAQAGPAPGGDPWSDFLGRLRQADRGSALARLPWTRREAEAVVQEASPRQVLLALDFQASRDLATGPEMTGYQVIHFATHGLLDTRHPQLSGLALSRFDENGRPQDGFLRLQDVYRMRLSADLVVLSGCETALGKNLRGEGIVGLTHGFFHAGASQVMASLWPVRDRATAELMERFYRALFKDGLRAPAALRQAQTEMWRERTWRDPYYWAAFVLQGDWRAGSP